MPRSRRIAAASRRLLGRVRRDPDVERLALPHRAVERAHRLLERRVRVEPVRVEDVDVLEAEPLEALVEAREQVLARAPLAVRAGPHVVARLRRDDELVAVRREVVAEQAAEVLLRGAVRRPVVVREVEVRDAEVERAPRDRADRVERTFVPEVLPEPERDGGQLEAAAPAAVVGHPLVAIGGRGRHAAPNQYAAAAESPGPDDAYSTLSALRIVQGDGGAAATEHPRHLGRRHRHHEPELLQRRPDGVPDAEHRPDRGRGDAVHRLVRRAELHRGTVVVHHRAERLSHRAEQGRHARAWTSDCRPRT